MKARASTAVIALALLAAAGGTARAASYSLVGTVPGGGPQIGAIHGSTLYGTVPYSTPATLFSLSTTGRNYTLLHSFDASVDGQTPNAGLGIDSAGNLYGTTQSGGADGAGTVWKYAAGGGMHTLHAFGSVRGDGTNPYQGPWAGGGGAVVGTTSQGAIGDSGNIFRIDPAGSYAVLYKFLSGNDGHCPFSGVALGKNGTVYGTTVGLGFGGNPTGSVFRFTEAGGLHTLYVFQDGDDGEWPDQAPVVDQTGTLYGTTHKQGGADFAGAIWTISALGQFSVLHDLVAVTDGFAPNSPLLLDTDGALYGTTGSGGAHGGGTVFRITPGGSFSVVHSFNYGSDGAQPTGNLVRSASGVIFGGTAYGTVFKVVP